VPVLVRIALRNLLEHKSKSLIIGSIIALGVLIIVLGNSLVDTAASGVHDTFIANYTGDVFISGLPESPDLQLSLFGVQSTTGSEDTPTIPSYDQVLARLREDPRTADVTSQVTGFGLVGLDGSDKQSMVVLFGVDASTYPGLFPGAEVVAGRYLDPGEEGIVLPEDRLLALNEELGVELEVGDSLLVNGFGGAGFKIREIPIVGLVRFRADAQGMDMLSYVNATTVRALSGMDVSAEDVVLSAEETELLGATDVEDIFGGAEVVVTGARAPSVVLPVRPSVASDEPVSRPVTEGGSWHFLLVRLESPAQADAFIRDTNAWFQAQGIAARAADWKTAAGPFAQSIDVIRIVFNAAIGIVAVVAVIIIMSTLLISVMERTGEIGTMRALGAQKGFVWRMLFIETLTITVVFAVVGFLLAFAAVAILNALRIPATDPIVQVLFAGKTLRLGVQPISLLLTLAMVGFVGVAAHVYPVSVALRVPPVRAMQSE
jgi:putative ABC transport system permease protein